MKAENDESSTAKIFIDSPPYGSDARPPDRVKVILDGEVVFSGVLPTTQYDNVIIDGRWIKLLEIWTFPGEHVLEVQCGKEAKQINIYLNKNQERLYHLFGYLNKKETLLQEIPLEVHL